MAETAPPVSTIVSLPPPSPPSPSQSPSPPPSHPQYTPSVSSTSSTGSSSSPRQGTSLLRRVLCAIRSEGGAAGSKRPRSKSSAMTNHEYRRQDRDEGSLLRPRAASSPAPFGDRGVPAIHVTDEILLEERGQNGVGGGLMENGMREGSECGSSIDGGSLHSGGHSPDIGGDGRHKKKRWLDISTGAIPKSFKD
ncbi:uncharacterized protein [Diadema setosum]|uniref:uncharacterized protein n=1 Tax=Diadema setosum TaxID=31175 RepID=UPI003B3B8E69